MELYLERRTQLCQLNVDKGVVNYALQKYVLKAEESTLVITVKKINKLLTEGIWIEGLHLLHLIIHQCPLEILKTEGGKWFRLLSSCLTQKKMDENIKGSVATLISVLVRYSEKCLDLRNEIIKVPALFVNHLLKAPSEWRLDALLCIYHYAKHFPGQLVQIKVHWDKEMTPYLTSNYSRAEIQGAGKVFAVVPLGGKVLVTRVNIRGSQLSQLIGLGHHAMDILLNSVLEKDTYEHTREHKFNVNLEEEKKSSTIEKYRKCFHVISNTLIFIGELLSSTNSPGIRCKIKDVIGVVTRILQVETISVVNKPGQEFQYLALILPFLHRNALSVISELLESSGDSISIYHGFLCQLLCQNLNPSGKDPSSRGIEETNFSKVNCYELLCRLMKVSKGAYSIPLTIAKVIIADILPSKSVVSLKAVKNPVKKGKMKRNFVAEESTTETICEKYDSKNAVAALQLLAVLFRYAVSSLPISVIQELSSGYITLIGFKDTKNLNVEVRRAMYAVAEDFVTNPSASCPPQFVVVQRSLKMGLQDADIEVVDICMKALSIVSFISANPQVAVYQKYIESLKQISHSSNIEETTELNEDLCIKNEEEEEVELTMQTNEPISVDEISQSTLVEPVETISSTESSENNKRKRRRRGKKNSTSKKAKVESETTLEISEHEQVVEISEAENVKQISTQSVELSISSSSKRPLDEKEEIETCKVVNVSADVQEMLKDLYAESDEDN